MVQKSFVALDGVKLIPAVAARLDAAVTGLGWSKSHVVNDSLIRTLGLESLGLSNDQVWGPKKKKEEVK